MYLVNSYLVWPFLPEKGVAETEELQAEDLRCPPSLLKTVIITVFIEKAVSCLSTFCSNGK